MKMEEIEIAKKTSFSFSFLGTLCTIYLLNNLIKSDEIASKVLYGYGVYFSGAGAGFSTYLYVNFLKMKKELLEELNKRNIQEKGKTR